MSLLKLLPADGPNILSVNPDDPDDPEGPNGCALGKKPPPPVELTVGLDTGLFLKNLSRPCPSALNPAPASFAKSWVLRLAAFAPLAAVAVSYTHLTLPTKA